MFFSIKGRCFIKAGGWMIIFFCIFKGFLRVFGFVFLEIFFSLFLTLLKGI